MSFLKVLHMLSASLVLVVLTLYAIQMLMNPTALGWLRHKVAKISLHILFTVLVFSGLWMILPLLSKQIYPVWIILKSLLFIILIVVALRGVKSEQKKPTLGIITLVLTALIIFLIAAKPFQGNPQANDAETEDPKIADYESMDEEHRKMLEDLAIENQESEDMLYPDESLYDPNTYDVTPDTDFLNEGEETPITAE